MAPSEPQGNAAAPWLEACGWALVYTLVAGLFQLMGEVPFDDDTGYHFAVSRMIASHGILHDFPWTPFSWLGHHYADKELLFHFLFLPLVGLSYPVAGKLLGTLLGAAQLSVMRFVLRRESVPRAGLWPLVALAACSVSTLRFALVRPHLISVSLALLATWAASRPHKPTLFAVALLYPLSYIAWHTPVLIVVLASLAGWAAGRRPEPARLGIVLAGLGLGLALHPNARPLMGFWWITHGQILMRAIFNRRAGFELGAELLPFTLGELVTLCWIPLTFQLAALGLSWRHRKADPMALSFALVSLSFWVMTVRAQRFIEYAGPFSAVAFALALRPYERVRHHVAALLAGATVVTALTASGPITQLNDRINGLPPRMVRGLRLRVPVGAQVFTCEWGSTGTLMLALPERHFMVGLDPVLFFADNPARYRLWFETVHTPPPDTARIIRERFFARYVLCHNTPERGPFFAALRRDPRWRPTILSPDFALFEYDPQQLAR